MLDPNGDGHDDSCLLARAAALRGELHSATYEFRELIAMQASIYEADCIFMELSK